MAVKRPVDEGEEEETEEEKEEKDEEEQEQEQEEQEEKEEEEKKEVKVDDDEQDSPWRVLEHSRTSNFKTLICKKHVIYTNYTFLSLLAFKSRISSFRSALNAVGSISFSLLRAK